MTKLTYNEALDAIAQDRKISIYDVQPKALRRCVYVAMFGQAGCMPDDRVIFSNLRDAIDYLTDGQAGDAPRGCKAELRRSGLFYDEHNNAYEVYVTTLADYF